MSKIESPRSSIVPVSFPHACRTWVLSQFGNLLQHPEALAAISLSPRFPDVAEGLGRRLEAGPIRPCEIEKIATENGTTEGEVRLLLNSLTGATIKPDRSRLVDFVLRDRDGKVVADSVSVGALIRNGDKAAMEVIFVSWEKAPL